MSGREEQRALGLLGLALLVACGKTQVTPAPSPALASTLAPPLAAPSPSPSGLERALASATAPAFSPDLSWPSLVRDEQWDAAWHALESVRDADKVRPDVRYVRARVALSRGDAAGALPLLEGLEGALPLLADDVARRRAEAKLVVGPFEEAG